MSATSPGVTVTGTAWAGATTEIAAAAAVIRLPLTATRRVREFVRATRAALFLRFNSF
jgi:hypothetical protein